MNGSNSGSLRLGVFVNFCINISDEDDDEKTITIYNKSNKRVTKSNSI